MLRTALARKRTGSPDWPTTRMPAACLPSVRPWFSVSNGLLAERAAVVQRFERDVVREDDQENEKDDDRGDHARTIAPADTDTERECEDDSDLDKRVEETGEKP
jgi:hypothetical protein